MTDLDIIKNLLANVLNVYDIKSISRLSGLTNKTFLVDTQDNKYVVRLPGEGTEEIIDRKNEKISTELACKLGIDAE